MRWKCFSGLVIGSCMMLLTSVFADEPILHRFLAKDESRAQLHYVDQFNPSNDWILPLKKGCRDIRLLPNNRVLVSYTDGKGSEKGSVLGFK